MDVNKIIMESISEVAKEVPTPVNSIRENTEEQVYIPQTNSIISSAIPSAISAGLGALTLRNKLRNSN